MYYKIHHKLINKADLSISKITICSLFFDQKEIVFFEHKTVWKLSYIFWTTHEFSQTKSHWN